LEGTLVLSPARLRIPLVVEPLEPRWLLSTFQDFDTTPGTPVSFGRCALEPGPFIVPTGPSGKFLRVATTTAPNNNSAAFDLTDPGLYNRIVAEFDFRISPPPLPAMVGEGIGFALLNTAVPQHGTTGAVCPSVAQQAAEEPSFPNSVGVGFDVSQDVGDLNGNHVSIHFNGALVAQADAQPFGSLDQGQTLRAQIILRPGAIQGGGDVTVRVKRAGQADSTYVTLVNRQAVPGFTPYEGRVWFGARSGTRTGNHDLDNVHVRFGAGSPGVFDPSAAQFYLRNSLSSGPPDAGTFQFGGSNWKPVAGDWDRDGFDTVGVVEPATGNWYLRNSNSAGAPDATPFGFGLGSWTPVVGDWNGDGFDTVGVFDPSTATWYLRNTNSSGSPDIGPFVYGLPGWLPVVGDWDGDGDDTVGVVDPGSETWFLSNNTGVGSTPSFAPFVYGNPGWLPVAGDWDGDSRDRIAAFDPATARLCPRNDLTSGPPAYGCIPFGGPGWRPIAGDWDHSGPKRASFLTGSAVLGAGAASLSDDELSPIVAAALTRLKGAGLGPATRHALLAAQIRITDLAGQSLGMAKGETGTIYLDHNAAGHGWFVDPTPLADEEFTPAAIGAASTVIDLLTALVHELGHLAGLDDLDAWQDAGDAMTAMLEPGVRRVAMDFCFTQAFSRS
jgi:hypothetical protein